MKTVVRNSFDRVQATLFCLYLTSLLTTLSGMEIFSTLLALVLGARFLLQRPKRERWALPPFLMPILAFATVATLSILLGSASWRLKLYDLGRLRFFLVYFVLFYQLHFFEKPYRWLRWITAIAVAVSLFGLVQHFFHFYPHLFRGVRYYALPELKAGSLVVGTFSHHLTFSNIFTLYFALFLGMGIGRNRRYLGVALLVGVACAWTQSRMALSAMPIGVAIVLVPLGGRVFLGGGALMTGILALLYATDGTVRGRIARALQGSNDWGPRMRLWRAQLDMFASSPIWGVGYNNNERTVKPVLDRLYPNTENFYGHAHSTPLQILSSTGLLGFLAFGWIWFEVFAKLLRIKHYSKQGTTFWLATGLLAAFVMHLIQGLTQWNFGDAEVAHSVMFLFALSADLEVES